MNTEYCINIAINGCSLVMLELPPRANEQQADAIARKFASRFLACDGYRFVVEPSQSEQAGHSDRARSHA